jgi:serine/threonine-protein kinase
MEYVRGPTLQRLIETQAPLEASRVRAIGLQIARALLCTESHDIVHRDIKPANIIVGADGQAKLADLGLALMPGEAADAGAGTPYYMSPEQIRGEALDVRSDIYSLGCTLFHALTGRPPYEGRSVAATLSMHERMPPPDAGPGVSEAFGRVLRRMMAKAPPERYPRAADLVRDLENLARGLPPVGRRSQRVRRGALARWLLILGIGLLAAALVAAVATALREAPTPAPIHEVTSPQRPPPNAPRRAP